MKMRSSTRTQMLHRTLRCLLRNPHRHRNPLAIVHGTLVLKSPFPRRAAQNPLPSSLHARLCPPSKSGPPSSAAHLSSPLCASSLSIRLCPRLHLTFRHFPPV
ncbi:hypothetical protein DFH09DRAFT_1272717 [Mycena vulgaris]|nr:hypothetical protein DFH09DRAFT_1272717 [Mycena vulgaris]